MKNSREAGKRGEREAAKYLASLGFGTYADDLHRFEWVVRARVAAAVRSALASARKKQTATTSKGKP